MPSDWLARRVRSLRQTPGLEDFDRAIFLSVLLCLVVGERHLLLRTYDKDIERVALEAGRVCSAIFGLATHVAPPCERPNTTSDFVRNMFLLPAPASRRVTSPPTNVAPHEEQEGLVRREERTGRELALSDPFADTASGAVCSNSSQTSKLLPDTARNLSRRVSAPADSSGRPASSVPHLTVAVPPVVPFGAHQQPSFTSSPFVSSPVSLDLSGASSSFFPDDAAAGTSGDGGDRMSSSRLPSSVSNSKSTVPSFLGLGQSRSSSLASAATSPTVLGGGGKNSLTNSRRTSPALSRAGTFMGPLPDLDVEDGGERMDGRGARRRRRARSASSYYSFKTATSGSSLSDSDRPSSDDDEYGSASPWGKNEESEGEGENDRQSGRRDRKPSRARGSGPALRRREREIWAEASEDGWATRKDDAELQRNQPGMAPANTGRPSLSPSHTLSKGEQELTSTHQGRSTDLGPHSPSSFENLLNSPVAQSHSQSQVVANRMPEPSRSSTQPAPVPPRFNYRHATAIEPTQDHAAESGNGSRPISESELSSSSDDDLPQTQSHRLPQALILPNLTEPHCPPSAQHGLLSILRSGQVTVEEAMSVKEAVEIIEKFGALESAEGFGRAKMPAAVDDVAGGVRRGASGKIGKRKATFSATRDLFGLRGNQGGDGAETSGHDGSRRRRRRDADDGGNSRVSDPRDEIKRRARRLLARAARVEAEERRAQESGQAGQGPNSVDEEEEEELAALKMSVPEGTYNLPDGFMLIAVVGGEGKEDSGKQRLPMERYLLDRFSIFCTVDLTQTAESELDSRSEAESEDEVLERDARSDNSSTTTSRARRTPARLQASDDDIPKAVDRFGWKHLRALRALSDKTYIAPRLHVYLSDLTSNIRHHPRIDGCMLTSRARKELEAFTKAYAALMEYSPLPDDDAPSVGAVVRSHGTGSRGQGVSPSTAAGHPLMDDVNADDKRRLLAAAPSSPSLPWQILSDHLPTPPASPKPGAVATVHVRPVAAESTPAPTAPYATPSHAARVLSRVYAHRVKMRDGPWDEVMGALCGPPWAWWDDQDRKVGVSVRPVADYGDETVADVLLDIINRI